MRSPVVAWRGAPILTFLLNDGLVCKGLGPAREHVVLPKKPEQSWPRLQLADCAIKHGWVDT